jgi:hypothetical protein
MAADVQTASTVNLGTRTNTTFTAPTGITNGDLLLIVMITGINGGVTPTPPTGFSAVSTFPKSMNPYITDPYVVRHHAWWKVASGESGNYTASHASADSEGCILRISGQAGTPFSVTPVSTDQDEEVGVGNVVTAPTITTAINGSLVVWHGSTWDGFGATSPTAGTTPTFTERANHTAGIFYCQTGPLTTAGATGTKAVSASQPSNRPWLAGMFVVDAAVAGGATSRPIFRRSTRFFRRAG